MEMQGSGGGGVGDGEDEAVAAATKTRRRQRRDWWRRGAGERASRQTLVAALWRPTGGGVEAEQRWTTRCGGDGGGGRRSEEAGDKKAMMKIPGVCSGKKLKRSGKNEVEESFKGLAKKGMGVDQIMADSLGMQIDSGVVEKEVEDSELLLENQGVSQQAETGNLVGAQDEPHQEQ